MCTKSEPERDRKLKEAKVIRVKTWEAFKRLAIEKKPKRIVYINAQGIPAKHLTDRKLILSFERTQNILVDCAQGNALKRTKIPVHANETGETHSREEDIKNASLLRTHNCGGYD